MHSIHGARVAYCTVGYICFPGVAALPLFQKPGHRRYSMTLTFPPPHNCQSAPARAPTHGTLLRVNLHLFGLRDPQLRF